MSFSSIPICKNEVRCAMFRIIYCRSRKSKMKICWRIICTIIIFRRKYRIGCHYTFYGYSTNILWRIVFFKFYWIQKHYGIKFMYNYCITYYNIKSMIYRTEWWSSILVSNIMYYSIIQVNRYRSIICAVRLWPSTTITNGTLTINIWNKLKFTYTLRSTPNSYRLSY